MKLYKANHYYKLNEGLHISDETGETVISIKGQSTNEVEKIARKILSELNREYYTKTALIKDNNDNYNMGLITEEERQQKQEDIILQQF